MICKSKINKNRAWRGEGGPGRVKQFKGRTNGDGSALALDGDDRVGDLQKENAKIGIKEIRFGAKAAELKGASEQGQKWTDLRDEDRLLGLSDLDNDISLASDALLQSAETGEQLRHRRRKDKGGRSYNKPLGALETSHVASSILRCSEGSGAMRRSSSEAQRKGTRVSAAAAKSSFDVQYLLQPLSTISLAAW